MTDGTKDILVGLARLCWDQRKSAWVAPGGALITDRLEAWGLAYRMNELMSGRQ